MSERFLQYCRERHAVLSGSGLCEVGECFHGQVPAPNLTAIGLLALAYLAVTDKELRTVLEARLGSVLPISDISIDSARGEAVYGIRRILEGSESLEILPLGDDLSFVVRRSGEIPSGEGLLRPCVISSLIVKPEKLIPDSSNEGARMRHIGRLMISRALLFKTLGIQCR